MKDGKYDYKGFIDIMINHPDNLEQFLEDQEHNNFIPSEYQKEALEVNITDQDIVKFLKNLSEYLHKILTDFSLKILDLSHGNLNSADKVKKLREYLVKLLRFKNFLSSLDYQIIPFTKVDKLITYINNEIKILQYNSVTKTQPDNPAPQQLNWLLTFQDFAFLIGKLKARGFIKETYENIAKHFIVQGEPIDFKNLKNTVSKLNSPHTDNYPSQDISEITTEITKATKRHP